MTFGGIAAVTDPYRVEPGYEDPTSRSVNAVNATRADALLAWMKSIIAERPDLAPKVVSPTTRLSGSVFCRMTGHG